MSTCLLCISNQTSIIKQIFLVKWNVSGKKKVVSVDFASSRLFQIYLDTNLRELLEQTTKDALVSRLPIGNFCESYKL